MKRTLQTILMAAIALILMSSADSASAQTPGPTPKKNFGYSQNPKTKTVKETKAEPTPEKPTEQAIQPNVQPTPAPVVEPSPNPQPENPTIAQQTLEVVKNANKKSVAPTETYLIGVGDVLFISLQNNSKSSNYFTVLNDGTIDYPLAGELVSVVGLNTDEIEEILTPKIKLFENPQVSVKVREFNSHKITVLGAVEKSGEKNLQREAVPLFVVRAEAFVLPKADRVTVRRADGKVETFEFKDPNNENVLIFPNDIVEFSAGNSLAANSDSPRFVFIGGEVLKGGKQDFHDGLTLTQAILMAGGLKKDRVRKVTIRRKNSEGLLTSTEYDLKLVKDGKIPDPNLQAGDVIEVGN